MKFGVFYELQLPKPWNEGDEAKLFNEALEQIELADKLGYDHTWAVEHHFLDEYSHCSAPEVFLAAAAARTKRIRVGHGIRQVISSYNHPARTAEGLATLDILSNGRVEFGFGEGATRLELGGFRIPGKQKRAMALEAVEQIANMMTMTPYPGFEGQSFTMPCRNVLPKPVQRPHPPLWMACTNRDTIRTAAQRGVGALAFSFLSPDEARHWGEIYYGTIKSEQCVPIGHAVNANIAMATAFYVHQNQDEAVRRAQEGFEFFRYAIKSMATEDQVPGYSRLWERFHEKRREGTVEKATWAAAPVIGTPQAMRQHIRGFEGTGVDQLILMQQAGRVKHEHICETLELFAAEVMPEFAAEVAEREARKAKELAPYIEAAMARMVVMPALAEAEVPVIPAIAATVQINQVKVAS